jgi:phenylalanyl-tRNA synthetase alpha chain
MAIKEDLEKIRQDTLQRLNLATSETDVYQIKSSCVGRSGALTRIIRTIKEVPAEQRVLCGKMINDLKQEIELSIETALQRCRDHKKHQSMSDQTVDVTLPGRRHVRGSRHPLTLVADHIVSIFTALGFEVVEGPEVELDFFNFEALNIPKGHPAREMHDTFYIAEEVLLRTHTSPVQIRTMQRTSPPLRIICPGKVYRCDSDITHTPMFHQIEGLMVGEDISLADLKGILTIFIHQIFHENIAIRFRPSFFPFTEPSAEVDIQCVMCKGSGCRVCSSTGWLEILGSGMVHPAVFKNVGYDPDKVNGFAFGLGVERITMLKYGINDIRLFFENDMRFLSQF